MSWADELRKVGFFGEDAKNKALAPERKLAEDPLRGYAHIEREDPTRGRYGKEFFAARNQDVNRGQDYRDAYNDALRTRLLQQSGVDLMRQYAQQGPQVSPHLLQAQKNALAQTAARQAAAGGGAMGARNAMLMRAGAGSDIAAQGVDKMATENIDLQQGLLSGVGGMREGDIGQGMEGIRKERGDDAYQNAKLMQAMGYLGMGEDAKRAKMAAELSMYGATSQQPQSAPVWPQILSGGLQALGAGASLYSMFGGNGSSSPSSPMNPYYGPGSWYNPDRYK